MQSHPTQEAIVNNLKDAGCTSDLIDKFLTCQSAGRTQDSLRVLALHRASLLEDLHASQFKLDCLDYLIRLIRTGKDKK